MQEYLELGQKDCDMWLVHGELCCLIGECWKHESIKKHEEQDKERPAWALL
jgi:hypothetical protein